MTEVQRASGRSSFGSSATCKNTLSVCLPMHRLSNNCAREDNPEELLKACKHLNCPSLGANVWGVHV